MQPLLPRSVGGYSQGTEYLGKELTNALIRLERKVYVDAKEKKDVPSEAKLSLLLFFIFVFFFQFS